VFVAFVDDELCAFNVVEAQSRRYCWNVVALAAGSPRLDANDDVSGELWTALLEYAVRRAGEAHVKRLFASALEGSNAHRSLRMANFESFSRQFIVTGHLPGQPVGLPDGMRCQEPSDVWSIHQLYHRTTPRAVQFAEALTSSTWEPTCATLGRLLPFVRHPYTAFVLETRDGVEGYCRVQRGAGIAMLQLMMQPHMDDRAVEFAMACATESGVTQSERLCLVVPAYAQQRVTQFERAGFVVEAERLAMVRHTTAPAVVHAGLAPLPALEAVERLPRGVPTYLARLGERGASYTPRARVM
jgi:hypothetical protein